MFAFNTIKNCSKGIANIIIKNTQFQTILPNTLKGNMFLSLLSVKQNMLNKLVPSLSFHTSHRLNEIKALDEFFDEKENWGAQEVKVGRSWKKEELRIKSNEDLHKLWYVLLKEKNMLLTMEAASKEEYVLFPNPERIDKVNDSMINLEEVVKERNEAYMLLETGNSGEREGGQVVDSFGRKCFRKFTQHRVPDYMHSRVMNSPFARHPVRTRFSLLLREKAIKEKRRVASRKNRYVAKLFQLYPDVDVKALKQKYPDVNVDKMSRSKMARGNHNNNMG